MLSFVAICHRCPIAACAGSCVCQAEPVAVPVEVRAASGVCPKDRFRTASLEAELDAAGYGPAHADFPGNSPCCGGGRKT